MELLQTELDGIKDMHNGHRIRKQQNVDSPQGCPNLLYSIPATYGELIIVQVRKCICYVQSRIKNIYAWNNLIVIFIFVSRRAKMGMAASGS